MTIIERAKMFAAGAHAGVGQKRKYTGEDYITHPIAVSEIVREQGGTDEMIAAALLHDTLEDTRVTDGHIFELFGQRVADMVDALTNKARPEDGDRVARFMINIDRLSKNLDMQTRVIKLADIIHNTSSVIALDQNFAARYLAEKGFTLQVLFYGHDIGSSQEEDDNQTGAHDLLIVAETIVRTGIAKLPPELQEVTRATYRAFVDKA